MATYGLTLVTAPLLEPVTLEEAALQCGIPENTAYHDKKLKALIVAAREKVETDTGRAIITQTWDFTCDLLPFGLEALYLPKNPVSAVTSVKYYDTANAQQTLPTTVYKTFLDREPAEIRIKYLQQWPFLYSEPGVITVRFVAGYGAAVTSVPESLKLAMLLLIDTWFENRDASNSKNEDAYQSLISRFLVGDDFHQYGRTVWQRSGMSFA
jgi:uncharacterized phiE125 gp8 family phage protein